MQADERSKGIGLVRGCPRLVAFALVGYLGLPLPLVAAQSADRDDAHAQATRAQAEFERTRRWSLPLTLGGGGQCDERIGRFCYWYDPGEPPAPPEPGTVVEARARLLTALANLATTAPDDGWIAGQRVRYLVEHGLPDSALAAAGQCRAEPWWCAALTGFALHAAQDFGAADRAYAAALAAMPETTRCEWNDLGPLLESPLLGRYRRLSCRERDSANAGILWRSRPLLSRAGNDLRTEVLARRTFLFAQRAGVTHYGSRLTGDLAELILRYGWATGFSRRQERSVAAGISVVGHEPRPAYAFLAANSPIDAAAEPWPPSPERPRARYAPRYARELGPIRGMQWARFDRGDSVAVVAAFRVGHDSLFGGENTATLTAAVVGQPAANRSDVETRDGEGVLVLHASRRVALASLEVRDSAARAWAVSRIGLPMEPRPLSDLLLYQPEPGAGAEPPNDSAVASFSEAARTALAGDRLEVGSKVGLYWEFTGGRGPTTATIRLRVRPPRAGLVTRLARGLGVAGEQRELDLSWETVVSGQAPEPRALVVDLSRLGPGRYTMELLVRTERGSWRRVRTIRLEEGQSGR